MKFDLSSLAGSTINSAILHLNAYIPYNDMGGYSFNGHIRRCTDNSWTESGISWNNAPNSSVEGTDTSTLDSGEYPVTEISSGPKIGSAVVTSAVASALSSGSLSLRFHATSGDSQYALILDKDFDSTYPYLEIDYTPAGGVHLHPDSDIEATGFTATVDQDFSPLYGQVDESSPSDTDYFWAPPAETAESFELGISNPSSTPGGSGATVSVRFRYRSGSLGAASMYFELRQSGTAKGSAHITPTTSFATYTFTATGITNYNNLTIHGEKDSSFDTEGFDVSWIDIEITQGSSTYDESLSLASDATVANDPGVLTSRSLSVSADGALTVDPGVVTGRSLSFTADGTIVVDPGVVTDRSASLTADATVSSTPEAVVDRSANLGADGSIVPTPNVVTDRSASIDADAAVSSTPEAIADRSAELAADSTLSSERDVTIDKSSSLDGDSTLSPEAVASMEQSASLDVDAVLNSDRDVTMEETVSLEADAVISIERDLIIAIEVVLDADGSIEISGELIADAIVAIFADGSMDLGGNVAADLTLILDSNAETVVERALGIDASTELGADAGLTMERLLSLNPVVVIAADSQVDVTALLYAVSQLELAADANLSPLANAIMEAARTLDANASVVVSGRGRLVAKKIFRAGERLFEILASKQQREFVSQHPRVMPMFRAAPRNQQFQSKHPRIFNKNL
jgi:hypothetical protein